MGIRPKCPGIYPAHTDSSLVIISPRSTASGLEAKDLSTGEWFDLEQRMDVNECIVFVGDPVDYASAHRYPALMHRASVAKKCTTVVHGHQSGDAIDVPRISTPF